jgi:hypothetical protein
MALTVKLDPGKHTVVIRKGGYFPIKFDINVEAGKTYNISKTLIPTNAVTVENIRVSPSDPKVGDTVDLTYSLRNKTNQSLRVRSVVKYNGKTTTTSEVTVSPNSPAGVSVRLGSFDTAGSKTVTIEAQVYVSEHENGAGWYTTDEKTYTFTVGEKTATVTITTVPSGADVYIDGEYKGKT